MAAPRLHGFSQRVGQLPSDLGSRGLIFKGQYSYRPNVARKAAAGEFVETAGEQQKANDAKSPNRTVERHCCWKS